MPEVPQLMRPSYQAFVQKINVKFVLKWTTFSLLILVIIFGVIWSLIDELTDISKIERELEEKDKDDMREYKVSVWSNHVLYLAYILLAIYAVIKEKYPLLLAFCVVDLILDFIFIWDFEGIFSFMFEMSVTLMCFITAIYYKYHQNIPWNPF